MFSCSVLVRITLGLFPTKDGSSEYCSDIFLCGFIFSCDGEPAGYIQRWSVGDEVAGGNAAEAPWLLDLPKEAVGVDLFIGEPGQLGQGIGTAAMRAFLDRLFAEGVSTVVIDPDETNLRAVRAYEKAGFAAYDRHRHKTGVTLLMKITQDERTETIS